jgi:hypothetical protein
MGAVLNKDSNIDIYYSTTKRFYYAGETVEGEIYLNVKQTSAYSKLTLCLRGLEHVQWSEGSSKHRRHYRNEYINYNTLFNVIDFGGTVNQGQYCFPFSFLLPATMTGTVLYTEYCYIKYKLKADLFNPRSESKNQYYETDLNILEPPRIPAGSMSSVVTKDMGNSSCCSSCCICPNENIVYNINCNKTFAMTG